MKGASGMKRQINLKPGDSVPIDQDLLCYVVEKQLDKLESTNEYEDYSSYHIGDFIGVEESRLMHCFSSFKEFLNDNCRTATIEEIRKYYEENYSNARVYRIYDDGSYGIRYFFVVEKYISELLDEFDKEKDNCCFFLRSEVLNLISKLLDEDVWDVSIGLYNGMLFLFCDCYREELLKISRKATEKETIALSRYVRHIQAKQRKKDEEELLKKEQAREKIYESYKSNPVYFPGEAGNYKQVLLEKGRKIAPEKKYSLNQIKDFYKSLLGFKGLSEEVKNSIIFYGGTIPYVLCNENENTRKFGDVDIFLPVNMMQRFRYELHGELNYIFDSINLTRRVGLIAKGFQIQPTNFLKCASLDEYTTRRDASESIDKRNAIYQDYGFKAILFGINISVFPLYDWTFRDGSIGVCAKSFRLSKDEGDWNFLLNTIVAKEVTIDAFYNEVCILGYNARVAKVEYTIASKRNAIRHGYVLRKDTDETDLEYIDTHSDELSIDNKQVKFFGNNIPDYCISHVYRITRSNEAIEISPEKYKHLVTRQDKPS